jgi:hypothetical protein
MKHLKVALYGIEGLGTFLKVLEQTHRGDEFGENGENGFMASNGLCLISFEHPEKTSGRLYVWGSDRKKDDFIIHIRSNVDEVVQAINEYNEHFKDPAPVEGAKVPTVKVMIVG